MNRHKLDIRWAEWVLSEKPAPWLTADVWYQALAFLMKERGPA